MSSFTKLIAPGVRTGFMIGEPSIIGGLAKVAEDTYISPGYVAQAITYEWCRRGLLPPQIERLKALYAPRLDATLAGLDKLHARRHGDAARRRLLHLADLAGRRQHDRGANKRRERALNLADGLAFFPGRWRRALPAVPFCALSPRGD